MVTYRGGDSPSSVASQAEHLKQIGNVYFKKDRFKDAIDAYTQAIALCPNIPVYWTNRALCHRKRNDWARVEEDSRRALQLDNKSVKAHYMLGLTLMRRQDYIEGVRELEKALDLGRGADPNGYMVDEIWQELAKAKYLEWENESSKRSLELHHLKEACECALNEKHYHYVSQMEGFIDDVVDLHSQDLNALERVFCEAAEAHMPGEITYAVESLSKFFEILSLLQVDILMRGQ